MKVKQHTLKGFECEISDTEAFKAYFSKNAPLMQGHLLMLSGNVEDEVLAFLDEKHVPYVNMHETPLMTRKKKSTVALESETPVMSTTAQNLTPKQSKVVDRPIRSGEAIDTESSMTFLGRINSGAVIDSSASLEFFATIDGLIRAEGDYLILRDIGKGNVFFHGEELDKTAFQGPLKLVEYKQDGLVIKEI